MAWFPEDARFAACGPRGLPIGNLTPLFWSNCDLHPFDEFVKRESYLHSESDKSILRR